MGCDDYPHIPDPDPRDEALAVCVAALRRAKGWVSPLAQRYELEKAALMAERALEGAVSEDPYPPFSGDDATCPKCGDRAGRTYQPAGTVWAGQELIRFGKGPDWMLRECFDCGHRWAEMCADA